VDRTKCELCFEDFQPSSGNKTGCNWEFIQRPLFQFCRPFNGDGKKIIYSFSLNYYYTRMENIKSRCISARHEIPTVRMKCSSRWRRWLLTGSCWNGPLWGYILGKPQTLLCIVNANGFFCLRARHENVEFYSTDDREMTIVAMLWIPWQ